MRQELLVITLSKSQVMASTTLGPGQNKLRCLIMMMIGRVSMGQGVSFGIFLALAV